MGVSVESPQNQLAPTNSPHINVNSPQPTRPTFIPTRPTYMPTRPQPTRPTLYQLAPHLYQLAPPISLQLQIRIYYKKIIHDFSEEKKAEK